MNILIGPYTDDDTPRQIDVCIDAFDTWSMDHTLAIIIVPMLKQLKATKHGAPLVEDDDVPEHLRSTAAPPKENEWDVDDNHFNRWEWVMDEMIWAMEQIVKNDNSKFFDHTETVDGVATSIKTDREGLRHYYDRIQNGCRLFGRYFQGLWD